MGTVQNKKTRRWNFFFLLVALLGLGFSIYNVVLLYQSENKFRLFMAIIATVIFFLWALKYLLAYRRNEP